MNYRGNFLEDLYPAQTIINPLPRTLTRRPHLHGHTDVRTTSQH